MARPLTLSPVDATFGAVVTGFRIPEVDDETFDALYAAWLKHALLIFPDQHLTREQQITFAKRFGPLEFEMAAISNVKEDGSLRLEKDNDDRMKILKGNMGWHADSTYMPVQAKGAVFCAEEVPTIGGHTGWADMRAAYDALDDGMKARIATMSAHHSYIYSQSKMGEQVVVGSRYGFHDGPAPLRPLVKIHPVTGRPSLFIGRHAYGIPGLDEEESETLLATLLADACQPPRLYEHDWRVGDLVVWDNRCVLHRVQPWEWDEPRVMFHTRISGDPATEAA